MTKLVAITHCPDCPSYFTSQGNATCWHPEIEGRVIIHLPLPNDRIGIPDWCPLPDTQLLPPREK